MGMSVCQGVRRHDLTERQKGTDNLLKGKVSKSTLDPRLCPAAGSPHTLEAADVQGEEAVFRAVRAVAKVEAIKRFECV